MQSLTKVIEIVLILFLVFLYLLGRVCSGSETICPYMVNISVCRILTSYVRSTDVFMHVCLIILVFEFKNHFSYSELWPVRSQADVNVAFTHSITTHRCIIHIQFPYLLRLLRTIMIMEAYFNVEYTCIYTYICTYIHTEGSI